MKELKPISAEALALFNAGSKGQTEYDAYMKSLRSKAEDEIKTESPNLSLQEQIGAARARFVTNHKALKKELREFTASL